MQRVDRLEEAKKLISDVHDDAQKLLSMIEMAIPLPQAIVKRVLEHVAKAKMIFTTERADERSG